MNSPDKHDDFIRSATGILSSTERCPPTSISNHFVDEPVQIFRFYPPVCNALAVKLAVKILPRL